MSNKFQNNLQPAGLLYRFVGLFGGMTEFLIIFMIINFIPLFIIKVENNNINKYLFATSLLIYFIYIYFAQLIFNGTFSQKLGKIYLVTENGKLIQSADIIKRFLSKLFVFLIWTMLVGCLLLIILFLYDFQIKIKPFLKAAVFFSIISSPLLMIPIINNRKQTMYDYLSDTLVLVNYEAIKKEEREHINQLINDPLKAYKENPNVSIQAVLLAIIILFILKILRKIKNKITK